MNSHSIKWRDVAETIGIIAIVASLYFVGQEIGQSQIIAENETSLQQLESTIAANSEINQHAEVWVRGLAGEELNRVEAMIFENLLVNMNDIAYHVDSNYRDLDEGVVGNSIAVADFASFLHRYDSARKVWVAREKRLADSRRELIPAFSEDNNTLTYTRLILAHLEKLDAKSI